MRSIGAALLALALPVLPAAGARPVVTTDRGQVSGVVRSGVAQFRGIPYAAPPVGPLRWMPPSEPPAWQGIRDASRFGGTCLQQTMFGPFAGPPTANEDCLFLNVFAPEPGAGRARLPVLVWLHGGGNINGAADGYDATALAKAGPMVVVTLNYRVGLPGFLAHPALDREGHAFANYGIMDQQAALRWVRRNVARFGGDPGRVTLGGQSAGASDTIASLVSPSADGLFQAAILQSGGGREPDSLARAEDKGKAFAAAAGCTAGDDPAIAACLRAIDADRLRTLSGSEATAAPTTSFFVVDGQIIPRGVAESFESGRFSRVPVLTGTTLDETSFVNGLAQYYSHRPSGRADYDRAVATFAAPPFPPGVGKEVRRRYALSRFASPFEALVRLQTDPFSCNTLARNAVLARRVPVFMYEFADRSAPSLFPAMPGFRAGATHTADLQFVFPGWRGARGLSRPLNARQQRLSRAMIAAWAAFVRTGNPTAPGAAPWPRFAPSGATTIVRQQAGGLFPLRGAAYARLHQCAFWNALPTFDVVPK